MHATDNPPRRARPGEIVLIAQTKSTLRPGQKPIRWIMEYEKAVFDRENNTDKIWGRHWKYLIIGRNLQEVEQFDIDDLKVTDKNYAYVQTFCYVEPEDEEAIYSWISDSIPEPSEEHIEHEFRRGDTKEIDIQIREFDEKYSGKPKFREIITRYFHRPSALSNAIKQKYGYKCQLCGVPGFTKKGGGPYAETHHMIEINKRAPRSLQSWNILVVCPTCHKKLHYADVESEYLGTGWKIDINGETYYHPKELKPHGQSL